METPRDGEEKGFADMTRLDESKAPICYHRVPAFLSAGKGRVWRLDKNRRKYRISIPEMAFFGHMSHI
jgi:hypothetical protein